MNLIASQLLRFRKRKILNDLHSLGWLLFSIVLIVVLILLSLESIFWFSTSVRYSIWWSCLIIGTVGLLSVGFLVLQINRDKIRRYSLSTIAQEIGKSVFEKNDEVLNAFQLEQNILSDKSTSRTLANSFVEIIHSKLTKLNPTLVLQNHQTKRIRNIALGTLTISVILILIFHTPFVRAAQHWIHPQTNFPVPLPFALHSLTGNLSLMGGDDVTIETTGTGKLPETVHLEIKSSESTIVEDLSINADNNFVFEVKDVFQNLHYRTFAKSVHFWQPWDEISSPTYTIEVADRPTIEDFTVTITPPSYTKMAASMQKGNIAEIHGLKGSNISIQLKADKELDRAFLKYGPSDDEKQMKKLTMSVNRRRASAEFVLLEDGILETHIFDKKNISNLDPIQYRLVVLEDASPELQVLKPESPMELGSDFTVPIHLRIEDDFGFSNLQIVYETQHPEYTSVESSGEIVSVHRIDTFPKNNTSQDVYYAWDVNDLNLMPEDELKFHFELYDNDIISGPKKAISQTLIARFPSLADIFSRTFEEEDVLQEKAEDIVEDLSEIDEALESLELELLKNEELNWEQEQLLKQSIEAVREELDQIQEMQEQVQKIIEQAEKHGLFSPELMDKFRSLQELLEDIITPELLESMRKLQEALEKISPEQMMQALENFRTNTSELEAQLDRFIEIFERIRAEQQLDEVVTRMENLLERQEELVEKLQDEESIHDAQRLADEEERNREEFENIKDVMEDASESMSQFAKMPAKELSDLTDSKLTKETSKNLNSATQQLRKQNISGGLQPARKGKQNLQQMLTQLQDIQQQFQQQTVGEMVAKFNKIFQNTLYISKEQEQLRNDTANLPRNSPRLGDMAIRQQLLRDQLSQLIQSLMQLSHQTFAVTPEMGKAIGRATAGMNESLKKLEERNSAGSVNEQNKTVGALNEAALATLAAMNDMQQSGSASGFEQFLERMQQLSGQQQGINSQTLQLAFGQMAASVQEALMKRLAREQEQLKKSLEQLMQEMRGTKQAGNLSGIANEMEEVIKDFKRRKVDRRTIKRQQRILSRMLDAQKSLRQRDLSKKRKATIAQDIIREGPAGLPADLGQRRNLAMEALNMALKSGYSRDYQEMIKKYFNSLLEYTHRPVQGDKSSEETEYVEP